MKEQKRLTVIAQIDAERMRGRDGAEMLGLSLRQLRRLIAAYRKEGAAGLAHGNRGRAPHNKIAEEVREQVLKLAKETYRDYNDTHFTEKLEEKHQIKLSRSSVRRFRRSNGQCSPHKRRAPRHRGRRERYAQPGMLLQVDGSLHDWLEGRGPRLTLLAAIDDASNEVPHALFREREDAAGYFELMLRITHSHGIPLAVYADRHTIFQSPTKATVDQQLAGQLPRSQFGRLMGDLAIELIAAHSPQAKGRVERLFGTLQDRLVKELREANACTLEEANQVLAQYLPDFNARFSVPPAEPGSAYRPWPEDLQPDSIFCFKHQRTVNNDNTISFDGKPLQIPPGPDRISYAKARVDVLQLLDGSLAIAHKDQVLVVFKPATPGPVRVGKFAPAPAEPLPSPQPSPSAPPKPKPRTPYKPPPDHPWRRYPISAKRLK